MRRESLLRKMALPVVMAGAFMFATSCSNEDYLPIETDNDVEMPEESFIGLDNIEMGPSSTLDVQQFKEAADRFSTKMVLNADNTISLVDGTTADDLKISEPLFRFFNDVIKYWNEHPTKLMGKGNATKGIMTATRGGNILCDVAASEIYSVTYFLGWRFTAKLFQMWYFDNRNSDYVLTDREWAPVARYSKSIVGQNYQNSPFQISDNTYYQNGVSFYQASYDLMFALGSSTVNFDESGNPVGLSDFYDFNAGGRDYLYETLVTIIRWIGDDGGFAVKYGIVKPAQD